MIRKQVYLGEEHERKLKAIAKRRGCSEAEIIREAIEKLPEPSPTTLDELLDEAGICFIPADPNFPKGKNLEALDRKIEEWALGLPGGLGLTDAILADREDRF